MSETTNEPCQHCHAVTPPGMLGHVCNKPQKDNRRSPAYWKIEGALASLNFEWNGTSAKKVGAVAKLLHTLAVLLEDSGDDDADGTIRMAALMARGNGR